MNFLDNSYLLILAILNYVATNKFKYLGKFALECKTLKDIDIVRSFLNYLKNRRFVRKIFYQNSVNA